MKKVLLFSALVSLVLMGCQKQTKFDFEDITTKSNLSGYIYYNAGYHAENGTYIQATMPASNKDLVVKVPYSSYSADAPGFKMYNIKTNGKGQYSLDIPVVATDCQGIVIDILPFVAPYSSLNAQNKLQEVDAFYEGKITNISVSLSKPTVVPVYTVSPDPSRLPQDQTRAQKVTVKGQVKAAYEKKTEDEGLFIISKEYKNYENAQIKATVTNSNDSRTLIFNTTTDSEGQYTLNLDLYNSWVLGNENIIVSIQVLPLVTDITHYYQRKNDDVWSDEYYSQSVHGYYPAKSTSLNLDAASLLVTAYASTLTVSSFVPELLENIYGLGYEIDMAKDADGKTYKKYRCNNPMGWTTGPYFYY